MPYLRLYSQDVSLAQKRVIARKLIDVTIHALQLRPEERNRITIQFVPLRHLWESEVAGQPNSSSALTVEVSDRDLTEEKKKLFEAEAASVLADSVNAKPRSRIARLLRGERDPARQVAFQFNHLDAPSSQDAWDTSDRVTQGARSRAA